MRGALDEHTVKSAKGGVRRTYVPVYQLPQSEAKSLQMGTFAD